VERGKVLALRQTIRGAQKEVAAKKEVMLVQGVEEKEIIQEME
jgi:hypothetical protein